MAVVVRLVLRLFSNVSSVLTGEVGVMGQKIHRHLGFLRHLSKGVGVPLHVLS